MFAPSGISNPLVDFLLPIFLTPEKLLRSVPIVLLWGVFGVLFFHRGRPQEGKALSLAFFNGIRRKRTLPSVEPS
jgi:hypothetical protein